MRDLVLSIRTGWPDLKPNGWVLLSTFWAALLATILAVSWMRTTHDQYAFDPENETREVWEERLKTLHPVQKFLRPAPAQLTEARLTELPKDWTPRDTHRRTFFAKWCQRPDTPACPETLEAAEALMNDRAFLAEWSQKRSTYLATLKKPVLQDRNLTGATLFRAHLPGMDLRRAQMEGADLRVAQMEGADLRAAQMQGAVLNGAQMAGADLSVASLEGADLSDADLQGSVLVRSQMQNADLRSARLDGALLFKTLLQNADLRSAQLVGVDLSLAQLDDADLTYSLISGTPEQMNVLHSTNLSAAKNDGGAFRWVDLRSIVRDLPPDLRNSFGDGSVLLPKDIDRPCQWGDEDTVFATDVEFFGRWRGWLESRKPLTGIQEFELFPGTTIPLPTTWGGVAPPDHRDTPVIPFDKPGCEWKTDPLPAPDAPVTPD